MKKLDELYDGSPSVEINSIKINSREVTPGDIFVCTSGVTADRHDFVAEAIKNGASAIVASRAVDSTVPVIYVENTNEELPKLASRFYDNPEEYLQIIAVTGTNGKTTVTKMIQDMIGNDICGYMGTNGIICREFSKPIRNTTPDADRLYGYLRSFVDSGCTILSMETSSESFYRKRLTGLNFEVGIITNITEDHLNIHKTLENYVSCKLELLDHIKPTGVCILNTEDKYFKRAQERCTSNIMTYGREKTATLRIIDTKLFSDHTEIKVCYQEKEYIVDSPAGGEFNVYNLLAAMLTLLHFGYKIEEVIDRAKNIKVPSGRVEFLNYNQPYQIVLDYAHTTDAFSKLYSFLNKIKKGNLITVTGSAGGREKEKRGPMGKLILDSSDYVIFTMDDPRYEDPNSIIDDLVSESSKTSYERIIDRKDAIYKAFTLAKENDLVLIAGKGIDNYMAVGEEYLPYSDLEVIEEYFKKTE